MQGFSYFPTVVYRDERPDFLGALVPLCKKYIEQHDKPNIPFLQTSNLIHDANFREVQDYILLSTVSILKSQGYNVDKYDFHVSNLWIQQTFSGGEIDIHVHSNSQMCGWLFVETPEQGSYPIYYDTRANKSMVQLDSIENGDITFATSVIEFNNVVPGTVMFNNSWMTHRLSTNHSDQPTTCLHFVVSHREKLVCSTF